MMIVASLFALVLAQADAPVSTAAPAAGAPIGPAGAIVQDAQDESGIPKGAPGDDYGLVAWCRGALTGHMALYTLVKPELKSIERAKEVAGDEVADKEQMQAGRDYLALYRRAMLAAEKASPRPLHARGVTIEGQGEAIWTAARTAAPRSRMWTWLMWDLPGRCEVAAKRLQTRSGLLGAAFRDGPAGSDMPPATETAAPSVTTPAASPQ